jgi:hypothetical protein
MWAGEVINIQVLLAGVLTLLAVYLISRGTRKSSQREAIMDEAEVP